VTVCSTVGTQDLRQFFGYRYGQHRAKAKGYDMRCEELGKTVSFSLVLDGNAAMQVDVSGAEAEGFG